MLKNYLTIIRRNFTRQPYYTLLNLACLSIGIASALFILLYLDFELNYDRFHSKADRIYRVETRTIQTHKKTIDLELASTSAPVGHFLQQDFPEVQNYTRFYSFFQNETVGLEFDGQLTEEEDVLITDSSTVDIFSFDFIYGSGKGVLDGPNKIILAETLAERIFGDRNPIGKIVNTRLFHFLPDVDPDYTLVVSGVYRDFPDNSHLEAKALISSTTDPQLASYYFDRFSYFTYILLPEKSKPALLASKLSTIYDKYLDPELEPVMKSATHELVPLTEIHLQASGGYAYLYIFAAIACLMLLIATISYVNLVTAQASKRALEIGIRKVMGSSRSQLIVQFLTESVVFTTLSLGLALLLVSNAIPLFNEMLLLQLHPAQLWQPTLIAGMLCIVFLLGILGGSYPAFFLSAFQPVSVMKGPHGKGAPLRRLLVAVQFAVVIFVLVSTGMIYQQMQFLQEKDLGFSREKIIRIDFGTEEDLEQLEVFKGLLKQSPLISSAGTSSFVPGTGLPRRPISADGGTDREAQFVHFGRIDYDYLETLGIALLAGRNFSEEHPQDATESVIINKMMARNFGLDNPVGEKIRYGDQGNPNFVTIVGLVQDFHQSTLHEPIGSQLFLLAPSSPTLAVKIDRDIPSALSHIEKSWTQLYPNALLEYHFLEEDLQDAYQLDQIRAKLFLLFSLITIIIAFLGLFGLAAFLTQQREKEIGIRKVLGASLGNVVFLISRDFLLLVSGAALPAFILAWYFIHQWLEEFAYQVEMNFLLFGLVLLLTLVLTLFTTGWQAARASGRNPAETLKNE